ncbi:MAG: ankyrin repeat domain-containing protein [Bacillota bacterium]
MKLSNLICFFVLAMGFNSAWSKPPQTEIQKLNKAIELDQKAVLTKFLRNKRINLNAQGDEGMTPLMTAASSGNLAATEALLKRKVALDLKNNIGDTALAIAVSADESEIAEKLIYAGASLDNHPVSENADTLLITASKSSLAVVKAILSKDKKRINETNGQGNTALMEAVRTGYNDIAKFLIAEGADTKLKNKDGKSALDLAKENYNTEAVKFLTAIK